MGYIKEPAGVDFVISPMPFSVEDRQAVSAIIARYKITGEIPKPRLEHSDLSKYISKSVAKSE